MKFIRKARYDLCGCLPNQHSHEFQKVGIAAILEILGCTH